MSTIPLTMRAWPRPVRREMPLQPPDDLMHVFHMRRSDVCMTGRQWRTVALMMKVLRAIGRWLGKVMTEGGPPSVGRSGEYFREESMQHLHQGGRGY